MGGLAQDIRYALRAARRAPVFSAIAIACLAIGIAVNATAFSVFDALMVRDLPGVARQKEINAILLSYETRYGRRDPAPVSTLDWELFRDGMSTFSSSSVLGNAPVALRLAGGSVAVRADFVSGDFFSMLGTQPAAGRLLTRADDQPGAPPAVVISYDLWRNEFGGGDDAIGKPLYIADVPFTIAGVAPRGFVGLYPGELGADPIHGAPWAFLPVSAAALVRLESRYTSTEAALADDWLLVTGRRRQGVTVAQVE